MFSELLGQLNPKWRLSILSAEHLLAEDPAQRERLRRKLAALEVAVVTFSHQDAGFSEASLPRLREIVSGLNSDGVEFFHDRVVLSFHCDRRAVQAAVDCFRCLTSEQQFAPCRVGVAEGTGATPWLELLRIARDSERV